MGVLGEGYLQSHLPALFFSIAFTILCLTISSLTYLFSVSLPPQKWMLGLFCSQLLPCSKCSINICQINEAVCVPGIPPSHPLPSLWGGTFYWQLVQPCPGHARHQPGAKLVPPQPLPPPERVSTGPSLWGDEELGDDSRGGTQETGQCRGRVPSALL